MLGELQLLAHETVVVSHIESRSRFASETPANTAACPETPMEPVSIETNPRPFPAFSASFKLLRRNRSADDLVIKGRARPQGQRRQRRS
jgi:hypothetical protein